MAEKDDRDVEKLYTISETVKKLKRLVECLEKGESFRIQVDGEPIYVPKDAILTIEHEREGDEEELEFQFKWKRK